MGKRRRRKTYTSKGTRNNVSKETTKMVHRTLSGLEKIQNILRAYKRGQNPWVTVNNTSGETNKRQIRVRANTIWGSPK